MTTRVPSQLTILNVLKDVLERPEYSEFAFRFSFGQTRNHNCEYRLPNAKSTAMTKNAALAAAAQTQSSRRQFASPANETCHTRQLTYAGHAAASGAFERFAVAKLRPLLRLLLPFSSSAVGKQIYTQPRALGLITSDATSEGCAASWLRGRLGQIVVY